MHDVFSFLWCLIWSVLPTVLSHSTAEEYLTPSPAVRNADPLRLWPVINCFEGLAPCLAELQYRKGIAFSRVSKLDFHCCFSGHQANWENPPPALKAVNNLTRWLAMTCKHLRCCSNVCKTHCLMDSRGSWVIKHRLRVLELCFSIYFWKVGSQDKCSKCNSILKMQGSFCLDHPKQTVQASGQNVNLSLTNSQGAIISQHIVSVGFDWQMHNCSHLNVSY